jgi:hypothetical protein
MKNSNDQCMQSWIQRNEDGVNSVPKCPFVAEIGFLPLRTIKNAQSFCVVRAR